jgi:hypothetical protein
LNLGGGLLGSVFFSAGAPDVLPLLDCTERFPVMKSRFSEKVEPLEDGGDCRRALRAVCLQALALPEIA